MAFNLGKFIGGAGQGALVGLQAEQQNKLAMERDQKLMEMKEQILAAKQEKLDQLAKSRPVGTPVVTQDESGSYFEVPLFDESTGALSTARTQIGAQLSNRMGETPEQQTKREIYEVRSKEGAKLDEKMKREPEIEGRKSYEKTKSKAKAEKEAAQEQAAESLDMVIPIFDSIDEDAIKGLYGRGESLYPELARSQKGIDTKASINFLIANAKLAARGQLKGQGTVSDFEAKMLGASVTLLENQDISPELAISSINNLRSYFEAKAGKTETGTQTQQFGSEDEEYEALLKRRGLK